MLDGKQLPWIESAVHLGHILHQSGNMDKDIRVKRASFIDESVEVREKFPLMPMGVLAPGSAHARPSAQPPIDVRGNFPARVSAKSL